MRRYRGLNKSGFTLIELLVVMVLITLLAGMLLPALGGARKKAWQVSCLQRLRQWGLGLHMYVEDHSGWMPWEGSRFQLDRPDAWYNILPEYLGVSSWSDSRRNGRPISAACRESIFVCPAAPRTPDVQPYWGYGMNFMLLNTQGHYGLRPVRRRRLSSLPVPHAVVFLTDKGATPDEEESHPTANPLYDFRSYWHQGGGNTLFCDGRTDWFPSQRLRDAFQTERDRLDDEIVWVPDAY